ncbi:hypothetical protein D3C84_1085350 [compost metagenome]
MGTVNFQPNDLSSSKVLPGISFMDDDLWISFDKAIEHRGFAHSTQPEDGECRSR